MALLLKISEVSLNSRPIAVSVQKSDKGVGAHDIGATVYVWFTDSPGEKSALASRGSLASVSMGLSAQKRDPSKTSEAYLLDLQFDGAPVRRPLLTDHVEAFRYDPEESAMCDIGRLHRDRNEKLIRVSSEAESVLAARFRSE